MAFFLHSDLRIFGMNRFTTLPHIAVNQVIVFVGCALIFLASCANPAASVKDEAAEFLRRFPDHVVETRTQGRELRYVWIGDANKRPVLFVHGSPGSWEGWAHFLLDEKLRERFQLIAVDRLGYGGSGEGASEGSLEKQAAAAMEALKVNHSGASVILVGHSYGGPVVARMAMSFPGQVGGVVFVASSVDPSLEKTKWYQYPASWWPIRSLIPSSLRVCNEEIFVLKTELERMLADWPFFRAKVVLIQGADDPLVAPENLDFLTGHIRKALIVKSSRVAGLNHFVPWKRPDLILDGIWEIEKSLGGAL